MPENVDIAWNQIATNIRNKQTYRIPQYQFLAQQEEDKNARLYIYFP